MSVLVHKNFLSEEDRIFFLNHVNKNLANFQNNPNGPNRKYLRLDNTYFFDQKHFEYLIKISEYLGIKEPKVDPMLGILYSNISKGGFIHLHVDSHPPYHENEFVNYRFNLMLNRGDGDSYDPIVRKEKYEVNTGDAWSFPASLYSHETQPVDGEEPRIVLQFGFILHKKEYEHLFNDNELILTKRMKEYYEKNTRNGIARSRKNFFGQSAEIVP